MVDDLLKDPQIEELCDLVDAGVCTPACLFGVEEGSCQCRCDSAYHGRARDFSGSREREYDAEREWLHTMADCCNGPRACKDERGDLLLVDPDLARLVNSHNTIHITRAAPATGVRALYRCPGCGRRWHSFWNLSYHYGKQWWQGARRWA